MNDLMVTCRIVSVHSSLISLKVNVPRKNITIFVSIDEDFQSGEFSSAQDRRFEVKVVEESIVRICSFISVCCVLKSSSLKD